MGRRIGFLLPGQGSQHPGMGQALVERWPELRHELERADDALGFALSRLCLEGPEDELKLTHNAQPAILLVSVLTARALESEGVRAELLAGHSLGELSALCLAGAYSLEDALRLVRLRGELMQQAVPVGRGTMAALKLGDAAILRELLDEVPSQLGLVAAANFNGPQQIVVSGDRPAVERVLEIARSRRIVGRELPVSAPFHCELMREAADRFSEALGEQAFAESLEPPIVTNVSGEVVTSGASAREFLALQVTHPVRWSDCVERMRERGIDAFVEVGPGKVLTGLQARIARDLDCWATEAGLNVREVAERLAG